MVLAEVLKGIDYEIKPAHIYTYCYQCPLRFETTCFIDWYGYAFKTKSNNERMFEIYKGDCRSNRLPLPVYLFVNANNKSILSKCNIAAYQYEEAKDLYEEQKQNKPLDKHLIYMKELEKSIYSILSDGVKNKTY